MPENTYTLSPTLNKNKIFLLQKSEVEKRLDPQFYGQDFKDNIAKIKKVKHKRLGEVVKFSTETWNQKDFFNLTFPYIEISEIDTLSGEIQNISQTEIENAPSRAKMVVRENDIIISTTRPNRGAISFIRKQDDFSIASTGFSVIRNITNPEINREYLFAVIRQQIILKQFEQRSSGGNYPAITQEELNNVVIPIPEINKQEKIILIFKICFEQKKQNELQAEKLLAGIDEYLLKELEIVLPTPPENILKNRMFTTTIKEISGGRYDPFFHQSKFINNIEAIVNGKYPVKQLHEIVSGNLIKGTLPKHEEKDGNNSVVQINCISSDGTISLDDLLTAKDIFTKEQKLIKGDVLVVITGATIGKIAQWNYEGEYFLGGDIVKFQTNSLVDISFVFHFLRSNIIQTEIKRNVTGATNGHLAPEDVKHLPIPVPSLIKQKEIAAHITDIRRQAQQLKDKTKEALAKAGKEIESILLS